MPKGVEVHWFVSRSARCVSTSTIDNQRTLLRAKQAEACAKHLRKGSKVLVAGRLQTCQYLDKVGGKRSTTEVVAAEVSFLDGKDTRTMTARKSSKSLTWPEFRAGGEGQDQQGAEGAKVKWPAASTEVYPFDDHRRLSA